MRIAINIKIAVGGMIEYIIVFLGLTSSTTSIGMLVGIFGNYDSKIKCRSF